MIPNDCIGSFISFHLVDAEEAKRLIENGANINATSGRAKSLPIHLASMFGK